MRIKSERLKWDTAQKRLNRARLLYARIVFPVWDHFPVDNNADLMRRDRWLNAIAAGCLHRGLWKPTTVNKDGSFGGTTMRYARYSLVTRFSTIVGMGQYWDRVSYFHEKRVASYTFDSLLYRSNEKAA